MESFIGCVYASKYNNRGDGRPDTGCGSDAFSFAARLPQFAGRLQAGYNLYARDWRQSECSEIHWV